VFANDLRRTSCPGHCLRRPRKSLNNWRYRCRWMKIYHLLAAEPSQTIDIQHRDHPILHLDQPKFLQHL
jgi:hypothetical protein